MSFMESKACLCCESSANSRSSRSRLQTAEVPVFVNHLCHWLHSSAQSSVLPHIVPKDSFRYPRAQMCGRCRSTEDRLDMCERSTCGTPSHRT